MEEMKTKFEKSNREKRKMNTKYNKSRVRNEASIQKEERRS